ncbi:MAG: arginine--tRNA ligase, partial [Proteobacteria bacterium]|nr:arginine--tRNA ligase [Pseudomonadota bacterium]
MARELLTEALSKALAAAQQAGELPDTPNATVELQVPRDARHGDFSTGLAMAVASEAGRNPREVADLLIRHLKFPEGSVDRVEIACPGFINFTLAPAWLRSVVRDIINQGDDFGRSDAGQGKRLLLEFVSANPTGPVAVVQGRAAAIGDTLAKLFQRTGWQVSREYYINDALNSTQIQNFAVTLEARYLQQLGQEATVPEDGYQGDYVIDMAEELVEAEGDKYLKMPREERLQAFYKYSLEQIIAGQQRDMAAFGVTFDTWFYESSLYAEKAVEATLEQLKEA